MRLLDSIVDRYFRNEETGRVVVFAGDRRDRGYLVKSEAEELKIRSFLRMFYFAYFSILLLGMLLANAWSTFFVHLHALGRPAADLLRFGGIYIGIYSLVVGLPYFLLWRSYKKGILSFAFTQDEVLISKKSEKQTSRIVAAMVIGLSILLAATIFLLIQAK